MTHDGLGKYLKEKITEGAGRDRRHRQDPQGDQDRRGRLLPAGRLRAGDQVVRRAGARGRLRLRELHPGVHRRARTTGRKRFEKAGLPIVGDDIKSQVGATIVHRTLARLFHDRGVEMARTSQLNVGGNMDFYNMLERERLESKKISKTNAVTSIMDDELPADDVYIGPSDYVPWLTDRKWAHIRLEGEAFGDVPLTIEVKLEVWDSPNSAGIVIDAVRCCKLALNHGLGGPLDGAELVPDEVAAGAGARTRSRATSPRTSSPSTAARRSCRAKAKAAHQGRGRRRSRASSASAARPGRILPAVATEPSRIAQVTPVALGAAPRGQPLRRAAVGRAVRARPPRRGGRAVGLARAGPRRARDRQGAAARPGRALRRRRAARRCSRSGRSLPFRRGGSVSLPLDVSRTIEELLERAELDFVHVHEPFAPSAASAALRHSRALNVGTLPLRHRARSSRPRWRAGWWSSSSAGSTGARRASPPRAT